MDESVYMTCGIKRLLLNDIDSADIKNALNQFRAGYYGSADQRPGNGHIKEFGSYESKFGTVWIINYNFFPDRNFITILFPKEYKNN